MKAYIIKPSKLRALPLSYKEKKSRSRSSCGWHVFVSNFFADYKMLEPDHQTKLLIGYSVREDNIDLMSIDSILTPPEQAPPNVYEVIKLAAMHWRSLSPSMIKAWNQRAAKLNNRPLSGRFTSVPKTIMKDKSNLALAMTLDWEEFTRQFHNSIKRVPSSGESEKVFMFGKESVKLKNMVYRNTYLNFLLKLCLFGHDFSKVSHHELVSNNIKTAIVHIASKKRMCELFTINGLCCASGDIDNEDCTGVGSSYFCCGKVSICRKGRSIVGYIISESRLFWKVHLITNEIVSVRKVKYDDELNCYKYLVDGEGSNEMRVEDYDPVRIKLYCIHLEKLHLF